MRKHVFSKSHRLISLVLVFLLLFTSQAQALGLSSMIEGAFQFIQEMALDPISEQKALDGALKGMFKQVDDYSDYFNADETNLFQSSLSGSFVGIGITMEAVANGIEVMSVFENSPAESAGLRLGDVIVTVGKQSMAGYTAEKAAILIKGPEGTLVTLGILRAGKAFTVVLTRREIKINPISWKIDGDVGVIRISTFNSNTAENFSIALAEVKKAGYKKVLLDLRDNPGGYVDQAAKIGQMILPAGLVTTIDFASDKMADYAYYSELSQPGLILAVLVNENSASASEILAAAVQDAENGFLVGKKTFGKGIVQSIFSVLTPEAYEKYGSQYGESLLTEEEWLSYYGVLVKPSDIMGTVKLTTGKYLTRNGREIHQIGLTPDFEANNRTTANEVDVMTLRKLESFSGKIGVSNGRNLSWERFLKASGFMSGGMDVWYDKTTESAVKAFQLKNKLKATGIMDTATTDKANRLQTALIWANDLQYAKAMRLLQLF